jgi:cytoskeletal protein CcmA (bactofilin family)
MQSEFSRLIPGLVVKGEISGNADVHVDGEVEGSVRLDGADVMIGPQGRVRGDIEARGIVVEGAVKGSLKASDRILLRPACSVEGSLAARRIVIEEGARFRGRVDMEFPESVRVQPPASNRFAAVAAASVAHFVREGL